VRLTPSGEAPTIRPLVFAALSSLIRSLCVQGGYGLLKNETSGSPMTPDPVERRDTFEAVGILHRAHGWAQGRFGVRARALPAALIQARPTTG
jgi:hypothetical protein